MYNFKEKTKLITTLLLSTGLIVGGLFHSSCFEEETVAPRTPKYCVVKFVNFYPKADGTVKPTEIITGTVNSDENGKCPTPIVEWKNQ